MFHRFSFNRWTIWDLKQPDLDFSLQADLQEEEEAFEELQGVFPLALGELRPVCSVVEAEAEDLHQAQEMC